MLGLRRGPDYSPGDLTPTEFGLIASMKTHFLTILAALILSTAATAATLPQPGDFYLISRDPGGRFIGSHKLYEDETPSLKKVTYCARHFFVRDKSVAWTQLEAERGNVVHVEYNFGRGWRPICAHPEREVTLEDIGVSMSPREFLASLEEGEAPSSRLAAFGALFRPSGSDKSEGSFHGR